MPDRLGLGVLVGALPLGAFLVLALVPSLRRAGRPAGFVGIAAMGGAFLAALGVALGGGPPLVQTWAWLPGEAGPMGTVGILLDGRGAAMLVLVTLVSLLVQVYSLGYLAHEPRAGLGRYYAYQALFAFSMLGLVLSPTLLQMFVFWELVGLCSYLLIGFWYDRPAAARAAVKAFWVTKLGDLGFVTGIVMLWAETGTFELAALERLAGAGQLAFPGLPLALFFVYCGAMGKSAQFPLHVWLPDAMEGPTPVSALIHAATMVTAGVFLVVRLEPLLALAPGLVALIGTIGAFTALLAATMACVEDDIKRVLAYSTVSQLGYMMAAAGAGLADAGFLHLLTHGLFKALLFLGAGAVIHAVGTNDLFRMGGLGRAMPATAVTFAVGTLALAGVWPLAGFFSKEAVLAAVWEGGRPGAFLVLALTAFLTAFYMTRVVVLAFLGRAHPGGHPHDGPASMSLPLWALAVLTVGAGLALATGRGPALPHGPGWLAPLSLGLAGAGITLAWMVYARRMPAPERLARLLWPLDALARRRYGLDALYAGLYRGILLGLSRLVGWTDRYLVDGVLNALSALTLRAGDRLRGIQTGRAQDYVYGVSFGVLALLALLELWGRR